MRERERTEHQDLMAMQQRTRLVHPGTAASPSEDFRSVIDDLTIRNKKLKRKLKKYEKLHDAHLEDDKLFEIRVHGLPPHKKRELEETLQKFAAGLYGEPQTSGTSLSGRGSQQLRTIPPRMERQMTAASSRGNADSAYASASGQQSMQSGQESSTKHAIKGTPQASTGMSSAQHVDIQSYLLDIPQGLLPRPIAMTEKSKKKVIVRRLEQIFAGKGASKSGHQQPIQQEEISMSAARDDRTERVASGRVASKEGAREARIMRGKRRSGSAVATEKALEELQAAAVDANTPSFDTVKGKDGQDSPNQRPTRPLDLDPNRAQVPADNFEYLRHLGFSPLEAEYEENLMDGHGYMYLNVLINMAQLHTLNVTPEFVKKALEQYSDKFEVTNDGRKVRWKGGNNLTRTSSNGSPDDTSMGSWKPSVQPDSISKDFLPAGDQIRDYLTRGKTSKEIENKLAYVPLFFHQGEDSDDDSDDLSDGSTQEEMAAANSSGLTSSNMRTTSSKKRQPNDGPIIFYSGAPFVTDLSGDWRGTNVVKAANVQEYSSAPGYTVGIAPKWQTINRSESKGPLSREMIPSPDSSMELDDLVTGNSVHGFSKPPSIRTAGSSTGTDESPDPVEFEASGVGGVHPSDNFALNVKSRYSLGHGVDMAVRSKKYPAHIQAIITQGQSGLSSKPIRKQINSSEILVTKRKDLPPSELPPPSYFPLDGGDSEEEFSDSDQDDDDDESGLSESPIYHGQAMPTAALQAWPSRGLEAVSDQDDSMDEGESESEASEEGDASPDMLAHARAVNPEAVRLAEREYDATLAERFADAIPAGSSAATAGGGSGFNSPATPEKNADGASTEAGAIRSVEEKITQPQRGILKRTRAGGDWKGARPGRESKSPRLEKPAV